MKRTAKPLILKPAPAPDPILPNYLKQIELSPPGARQVRQKIGSGTKIARAVEADGIPSFAGPPVRGLFRRVTVRLAMLAFLIE